jgi:hypothetical protein
MALTIVDDWRDLANSSGSLRFVCHSEEAGAPDDEESLFGVEMRRLAINLENSIDASGGNRN